MNNYQKVYSAAPNAQPVRYVTKKSTTEKISQLRKELGLNPVEENFLLQVRKDFRLLNNKYLS